MRRAKASLGTEREISGASLLTQYKARLRADLHIGDNVKRRWAKGDLKDPTRMLPEHTRRWLSWQVLVPKWDARGSVPVLARVA